MFGFETLDLLIGLVTIYLTWSIACTAIVEAVMAILKVRSRNLRAALDEFFAGKYDDDQTFANAFYRHPLIQALSKGENGLPSYIPAKVVGQVVESLVMAKNVGSSLTEAVEALPDTLKANRIKGMFKTFSAQAKDDLKVFREVVENHFDLVMERASGWFKRYTQLVSILAATVLVILANVDTIDLASSLATNPSARQKMVEIAEQRVEQAKTDQENLEANPGTPQGKLQIAKKKTVAAKKTLETAVNTFQTAGLNIGWKDCPHTAGDFLMKIIGLLISIFSISLGAPFWFDLLQRFMQVRASGSAHNARKKAKKDK